jgi:hypothetical protein
MVFKSLQTNDSYPTPSLIYELLDAEFHFDIFDPCPLGNPQNIDGLTMTWPLHTVTPLIVDSNPQRGMERGGYRSVTRRHYKGR